MEYSQYLREFQKAGIPYDDVYHYLNIIKSNMSRSMWIGIDESLFAIMLAGEKLGDNHAFREIYYILGKKTDKLSHQQQVMLINRLLEDLKN